MARLFDFIAARKRHYGNLPTLAANPYLLVASFKGDKFARCHNFGISNSLRVQLAVACGKRLGLLAQQALVGSACLASKLSQQPPFASKPLGNQSRFLLGAEKAKGIWRRWYGKRLSRPLFDQGRGQWAACRRRKNDWLYQAAGHRMHVPTHICASTRGRLFGSRLPMNGLGFYRRAEGYIMYLIVLLVLTVMGTTIALADRTTAGLAGQIRQSALRDAELATENGLIRTISDFNSPGNRYVWGVKTVNWTGSSKINNELYPSDDCTGKTDFPNNADLFNLTGQTQVFDRIRDRGNNVSAFSEEWLRGFIFQVIGITIKDENHAPIDDITKKVNGVVSYPKGPSYVEFRVRGTHNSLVDYDTNWNNATNQSKMKIGWRDTDWTRAMKDHDVSFEITREYRLVPFCCKTGFIDKVGASDTRTFGSAIPDSGSSCSTTYNPDNYNLSNPYDSNSSLGGNSKKEKMGWTIVGPSSTGIFRSSL